MRLVFRFLGLVLILSCLAGAQERVKFLIPSKPDGAIVKRNNEEWGVTGKEFSVDKSKLPRSGNLHLVLVRKNYREYQLTVSATTLYNPDPDGVVRFPKSPVTLEPSHPLVPLQEKPHYVLLGLLVAGGVAGLVRRNRKLKQDFESREQLERKLKDQISTQHEFAFSTVGRYRVLDQLGEGGIAKVFRALPNDTLDESKELAIKILHPHLCKEEGHRERFIREGKVSQGLIHPNIIRLYEIDTEGDVVYLALELLKGHTLKEEMKGKILSLQRVEAIMGQVLDGLVYAHSEKVVHRDLTPSNIMITPEDKVKLMDFGLARSREVGHTITVTGVVQGTPGYMAPEQLTETLDARTDQYSFGVILFEMLTGRRPIERSDPMQLIMATYTEDAPDPREFNPEVPEPVAVFILKLLSRDPENRYADMKQASNAFYGAFNRESG